MKASRKRRLNSKKLRRSPNPVKASLAKLEPQVGQTRGFSVKASRKRRLNSKKLRRSPNPVKASLAKLEPIPAGEIV
ncbi:hypothetical protein ACPW7J_01725 [Ihubacter sp. rT4E-8]|uniref:hypothetical protein n=1 Tax=Ihubacter sp. rT4E-8 TaxID=3242369 RepID=UPI003CEF35C2